jgi:hypothetical protein
MKNAVLTTCFLLSLSNLFGQGNNESILLETRSKTHLYYVELIGSVGKVYEMGSYLDKAGTGYSIRRSDTLSMKPDRTYIGQATKVVIRDNVFALLVQNKKAEQFALYKPADIAQVHMNLNNAYYLDNFFSLCKELNKTYPLYHSEFRNGFRSWKEIDNKVSDPVQFKIYADYQLRKMKDSISAVQDHYVLLTSWLIQNVGTIDYLPLKDSLAKLPAEYRSNSWYFGTVINEVSKQRPEYFFRLAEDFPDRRTIIFSAAEDNKQVMQSLKAVENHSEIKKQFFKERNFDKTMPYKTIGLYAIVAGLITFLIVRQ